tara:strand:- start:623 stop:1450 length:828 start_codon:yes stop_codon:yes gene_type:complete
MNSGWIKIHRKLWKNPRAQDPEWVSVWLYLLSHAAHTECRAMFKGQVYTLKPGQLVTGRKIISRDTGVHESKVFRIINQLKGEQQIEQQAGSKSSMFTVLNWESHQVGEQQIEQQANSRLNSNRTPSELKTEQQNEQQESSESSMIAVPNPNNCKGGEQQNEQQMNIRRTTDEQQMNTEQEGKELKNEKNGEGKAKPGSIDDVLSYAIELKLPADDARGFWDHFESNGWKVGGKSAMKDWRAALRNWQRTGCRFSKPANGRTAAPATSSPYDNRF